MVRSRARPEYIAQSGMVSWMRGGEGGSSAGGDDSDAVGSSVGGDSACGDGSDGDDSAGSDGSGVGSDSVVKALTALQAL